MSDKFPPWMMRMAVNAYGGSSWLPLNNLVEIRLEDCKKCDQIPTLGHLPCLRVLKIFRMCNVKFIGAEFYGYNQDDGAHSTALFPALKKLGLWGMVNLVEWVEAPRVAFPCLEDLSLDFCRQLITAPSLFSTLRKLKIRDVVSSTPLANISTNLSTLTSLDIERVSELCFLPEGLLQNNKNLAYLNIWNCPALTYIAPHVLGCCTSLQWLTIWECEILRSLPDGLNTLISLEHMHIRVCPKLKSIPSIDSLKSLRGLEITKCEGLTSLPSGLESCMSLENLIIEECPNLTSISESHFRALRSLSNLTVANCGKLKCLPEGLHCLTRLESLNIGGFWEELDSFPNFEDIQQLQQLRYLRLHGWPKLKSLPHQLPHLTALTSLYISDFDGVKALPEWLGNLSSLEELDIRKCKNLKYLPEAMRRLNELKELRIVKCPLLEKRCTRESDPDWSKISHIPDFKIFRDEEDEHWDMPCNELGESDDLLDESEESADVLLAESGDETLGADGESEDSDDVLMEESYETANDVLLDESDESAAGDS